MAFFGKRQGYKTYLGALGLAGLAVFQLATGHVLMGLHGLFLAIVAAGLRAAIADLNS